MSYATSSDQSAMTSQDSSTPVSTSTIPDLVKIGQIPSNTAIDIETDILDPVVHSDTFCRFQLQNKGILHSNSKIILRMLKSSVDGYVPLGIGIHSLIERCALRVGTKTISEIDDFNHYIGYKSMFLSNEHQKQREAFVSGRRLAHKPYLYNGSNASYSGANGCMTQAAPFIGLDNGGSLERDVGGAGVLFAQDYVITDDENGVEFAISIQDLFPFLYTNQLPLFMMKEPVTIELFFSPASGKRLCLAGSDAGSTGHSFPIDTTATELIADYQYFPQEMMEEYARQNADMTFTYMDYRLAKRSIKIDAGAGNANATDTNTQIINVGGAGRLVTKVISMLSDDTVDDLSVLNNYHARACIQGYNLTPAINGCLTSNVKYNDHFLYPVDVDNSAQQFYNVVQAEGMVPFVTREEYANQGTGMTLASYEGVSQSNDTSGLVGKFFYQAYKLNRNERINQRGIELYQRYDGLLNLKGDASASTCTLRSYLELVRVATLKDGVMETFLA